MAYFGHLSYREDVARTEEEIQSIIVAVRRGDTARFAELLEEFTPRIHQKIWRQLADDALAEELTHETFLKAFKRLHQFRGESPFIFWLQRIAQNTVNTFLSSRRGKDRKLWQPLEDQPLLTDSSPNPEQQAADRELLNIVRQEINSLPSEQADVIRLAVLNDHPAEEVARILGIPRGTVVSRINRALKKLLERVKIQGENNE